MAEGAITLVGWECRGRKLDHCILRELRISNKYMHKVNSGLLRLQLRDQLVNVTYAWPLTRS
jgi:hypothetical protein